VSEGLTGNMVGINYLVEEDIDGDGRAEIRLVNGQWVGFDAGAQRVVVKQPRSR
jgi:hypothetical protein